MKSKMFAIIICMAFIAGCMPQVDITKTAKGYFDPTVADNVEVLMTVPTRKFVEIGTITAIKFYPNDQAKLHNALRAKAAPLGANAVILRDTGIDKNGQYWATGVAIRYE